MSCLRFHKQPWDMASNEVSTWQSTPLKRRKNSSLAILVERRANPAFHRLCFPRGRQYGSAPNQVVVPANHIIKVPRRGGHIRCEIRVSHWLLALSLAGTCSPTVSLR